MTSSDDFQFVIGRIIGGAIVAAAAFGLLSVFNSSDFGPFAVIGLSIVLGIAFSVFGRGILRWIYEVLDWL
jgi:hypothetical protein